MDTKNHGDESVVKINLHSENVEVMPPASRNKKIVLYF